MPAMLPAVTTAPPVAGDAGFAKSAAIRWRRSRPDATLEHK